MAGNTLPQRTWLTKGLSNAAVSAASSYLFDKLVLFHLLNQY
jgi:hypothetical protein